jgi:hypothetical protein
MKSNSGVAPYATAAAPIVKISSLVDWREPSTFIAFVTGENDRDD